MDKNIFRKMSYGVYAVTAWMAGKPTGCIANSIMQITSSPATVAVSMNHNNYTNECIQKNGLFAVSVLAEDSDPGIIGTLGFQSGKEVDKFADLAFEVHGNLPVISDSCGYLVCKVIDKMETATHTVFLGEVVEAETFGNKNAMTYAYYHNVVKGKSPKNAPTYIEEEPKEEGTKWVCSVCQYRYDGEIPFEELPDDYRCPICKMPKNKFVKQ